MIYRSHSGRDVRGTVPCTLENLGECYFQILCRYIIHNNIMRILNLYSRFIWFSKGYVNIFIFSLYFYLTKRCGSIKLTNSRFRSLITSGSNIALTWKQIKNEHYLLLKYLPSLKIWYKSLENKEIKMRRFFSSFPTKMINKRASE